MEDMYKYSGYQKLKKTSCPKIRYGKGGGGGGSAPEVPPPPPPAPKQVSYSKSSAAYKEQTKKQKGQQNTILTSPLGVAKEDQTTKKKTLLGE